MKISRTRRSFNDGLGERENPNQKKEKKKDPQIKINNQLNINYQKVRNVTQFFTETVLKKFTNRSRWNLEVWVGDSGAKSEKHISCGVTLKRPSKKTLYIKKVGASLNEAVRNCILTIDRVLSREQKRVPVKVKNKAFSI